MGHRGINSRIRCINPVFIIFTQPSIKIQPAKSTLHNPTPRNNMKTCVGGITRLYFNINAIAGCEFHKCTRITLICPDFLNARKVLNNPRQKPLGNRAIPDVGFSYESPYNITQRIHNDMAFAPLYFLAAVITLYPPFSVVLTDWLSMIKALGVASRPSSCRMPSRRISLTFDHVPSCRHVLK